jgi:hypothetical protein
MPEVTSHPAEGCSCVPFPGSGQEEGVCKPCSPNMTVTCEELNILSRMREIKHEARSIDQKMKDIRKHMAKPIEPAAPAEPTPEWTDLSLQLEGLRANWKDWEHKLQEAIEQKLVLLGHREPR